MIDARINETKLLEYLDSYVNWSTFEGALIMALLKYMPDDDIKRFTEIYELKELDTE